MRVKKEHFIVAFPTTTGAMHMEQLCKTQGVPGRLIPIPRSITAGCGMCWSAPIEARSQIEQLLIKEKIQIEGLYVKEF